MNEWIDFQFFPFSSIDQKSFFFLSWMYFIFFFCDQGLDQRLEEEYELRKGKIYEHPRGLPGVINLLHD
jgi:hypothetical protein